MTGKHTIQYYGSYPPSNEIVDYFKQFNIKIVHETILPAQPLNPVLAVLLHESIFAKDLSKFTQHVPLFHSPVIVCLEHPNEDHVVQLLKSGADDVLCAPFSSRELHARINTIDRRLSLSSKKKLPRRVCIGPWHVNVASREIFDHHQQPLMLSASEFDLLLVFIKHPQKILDRSLLYQATHQGKKSDVDAKTVDLQMTRLRQKIETDPKKPELIKTIRNRGYVLTVPVINES